MNARELARARRNAPPRAGRGITAAVAAAAGVEAVLGVLRAALAPMSIHAIACRLAVDRTRVAPWIARLDALGVVEAVHDMTRRGHRISPRWRLVVGEVAT